jgi:iron complex transport system ATP-binding protein
MELKSKAITVEGLYFAYNGSPVLNNVNVDIEAGKLTIILGRNGSGKSTFLRILAGLLSHEKGKIKILEYDSSYLSFTNRAKLVGFLNQHHKAIFPFTAEEVVLTGRAGYVNFLPKESDRQAAFKAMEKTGIEHLKSRNYTELSGGEQQLVMIARVLAQSPKILLLDEPTSHLDLNHQSNLLRLLKTLTKDGLSVICVFHDPNLAFLNGDDFLFVRDKEIIRQSVSTNPWDTEFLKSIYQVNLEAIPYKEKAFIFTSSD